MFHVRQQLAVST